MKNFINKITHRFVNQLYPNKKKNNFDDFSIASYSQEGEDMILRCFFGTKKEGYYIDVGALHPKRFSNTYYFYKLGWRGINIDAMPGSMDIFNSMRSRDINIEKPVSNEKKILTYYAFNEPALNSFSEELSKVRNELDDYKIEFTKEIETATLDEILEKNLPVDQTIDFLSIDVEGLDFEVISSINLKKYRPRVILVEILGSSLSEIQSDMAYKLLEKENYELFAKTINTVFFKSI